MEPKIGRHRKEAREREALGQHAAASFRDTHRQYINLSRLTSWQSASEQASAAPVASRDMLGRLLHATPILALIFAIAWFAFCLQR